MRSTSRSACIALVFAAAACVCAPAQSADPVADRLGSMTLEEKVGQLLAIAFTPRAGAADNRGFAKHVDDVRDLGIGGVTFFRGSVGPVRECLAALHAVAKTPLVVMSDVEFGLPMRVNEGTRMPLNMALGATGDPSLAYESGRVTATEARAVGIHVAFAPVVDVNNNPGNIIINTRSYGEDPAAVGRFGSAFIRGLQAHGVYATAKHYPGHGDTSVDSHLSLPTIDAPRARLERVELAPFRAAVEAGVRCVMVGHITFARVPEMKGRPASLDPHFIEHVLRGEMRFGGLVITDAMNMGGITEHYGHGEAAVLAVEAGVDVVLMPGDVRAAHAALVAAVREGRVAETRIDASVRRVLALKADAGLFGGSRPAPGRVDAVLRAPAHVAVAERIADRAVTLVADRRNVVPFAAERLRDVLVVTVTDERRGGARGGAFVDAVRRRVPGGEAARIDPTTSERDARALVARAKTADAVVVAITVKWRDRKGSIALPKAAVARLAQLLRVDVPLVVVAFGSPYVLGQLPTAPAALCVYDPSALAARAAARALFGECAIGGRLPVSIPGRFERGAGLDRAARTMALERALDGKRFRAAWSVLERRIADGVFPGAQVAIVRDGRLVASRGLGRTTYEADAPAVTTETVYDVASVTKVAATTTVAMVLADRGELELDAPVANYLPSFTGGGKAHVTIRHLLTHTSGLPAWAKLWAQAKGRDEAFAYIDGLSLASRPGTKVKYSDLGMITLGRVLERVGGAPLDVLARDLVFAPLGMTHTTFKPPAAWRPRIAPTEVGGDLSRGLIHGEVHDENAHVLGGVAGHAGVFSTAEDLATLAQAYLDGGIHRHHRLFAPATVDAWTTRQSVVAGSSRALGWDTPSAKGSLAGDRFSKRSFGHTGFTGTSIWVDRERRVAIVLLTNRVHPTRKRGGMREARRAFYNAAMKAALGR